MKSAKVVEGVYDDLLAGIDVGPRPRGGALQRSDIIRHIAMAVVARHWEPRNGPVPRRNDDISGASRSRLEGILAAHWDVLASLCTVGEKVSAAAINRLRECGVVITPAWLSERVAVRLAGAYRRRGRAPTSTEVDVMVAEVVKSVLRTAPRRFTAEQFRTEFGAAYDLEWNQLGQECLEGFRPSSVGLGDDARPRVAPRPGTKESRGGWHLGLGRSVYGRYRLFTIASARSRTAGPADTDCADHADHERQRDLAATGAWALGLEEVRRACSPYGLAVAEHGCVILAIGHALGFSEDGHGPARQSKPWHVWSAARCKPLAGRLGERAATSQPDDALVAAIRDYTDLWRASRAGRSLEHQYGPVSSHIDIALTAVSRKTWMELHRRERERVEPARRSHVARAVRLGFGVAIPELLQMHRGQLASGPLPASLPATECRPGTERLATVEVLLPHAAEVAAWRDAEREGDRSWAAHYREILATAAGPEDGYLTIDQLAGVLLTEWSDDT